MRPLLLTVLALTLAAPSASAAPMMCGRFGANADLGCAVDNGTGGEDLIVVKGPNGVERISVVCYTDGSPWKSYGSNTESYVNSIAISWCAQ